MQDFQTPEWICNIMVSLIDSYPQKILEPTPGEGNLVNAIHNKYPNTEIIKSNNFETQKLIKVDYVIANPPFSPMSIGYKMLNKFFYFSGNIIVIMPWLSIINSEKRTDMYIKKGLEKVIHLPRSVFKGSRVQTCILKFKDGYSDNITLSFISSCNRKQSVDINNWL